MYPCTTFRGTAPLKFDRAKNVQNSARFRTSFNFERRRRYLWNKWSYRQAVNVVINCCPFWVENLMNFGPLTTKLCLLISTYPTSTARAFSYNFRLWSHISRESIEISINEKRHLQLRSTPRRTQKHWWTWVHKQQSSVVSFQTTQV